MRQKCVTLWQNVMPGKNQFDESKKDLKCISNLIFAVYNEEAYDNYSLGGEWKTMEPLEVARDFEMFQRDLIRDAQREWISEGQLFYLYKRLGAKIYFKEKEERELNKSEYMLPIPDNQSM